MYYISVLLVYTTFTKEKIMKKQVKSEVLTTATASLKQSIADDLKSADGNLKDLLNEDSKRNDGRTSSGDNPESVEKV